jgi:hypothetical protein
MSGLPDISKQVEQLRSNDYIKMIFIVFIAFYGSLVSPGMPIWIAKYITHPIFRFFIILVIGLFSLKDMTNAIVASIAVMITLTMATNSQFIDEVKGDIHDMLRTEEFQVKEQYNDDYVANIESFENIDSFATVD